MKSINIRNLRKNIKKYLDEVHISEEEWIVTKYGSSYIVLLSSIEFCRLKKIERESTMSPQQKKMKQFRINLRKTDPLFK